MVHKAGLLLSEQATCYIAVARLRPETRESIGFQQQSWSY